MPLPGGPADKLGNRYEQWWTVYQLVLMLKGPAESIRIEDPGINKAEFVVTLSGQREYHQAKRSNPEGKWSLSSLGSADVRLIQEIPNLLQGNESRFVFVSESDAPELKELGNRARDAETFLEFESVFLAAKESKANFHKLCTYWKSVDFASAYNILRRIFVTNAGESIVEDLVRSQLEVLFLSSSNEICEALRCLVSDSVHRTITQQELVDYLVARGHTIRRLARPGSVLDVIRETTESYLASARNRLIRASLISRPSTLSLLERLTGSEFGTDSVIIGKAGVGKTACVYELVTTLRNKGLPVLAFRLDRLEDVSTPMELGKRLGLEESPVLLLESVAKGAAPVLVIDQFDAVSMASGRSSGLLDAVEGLLREARGIRDRVRLHVVVVCRKFDLENDPALLRAIGAATTRIELEEFSVEETRNILTSAGYQADRFQERQVQLLRLPQNLALFLESNADPSTDPSFISSKELFDRFWDTKRQVVAERTGLLPDRWNKVIAVVTDEVSRTQQLFVQRERLDGLAPQMLSAMVSEGVLTFDDHRYGFGHESLFDYCFARTFVAKDKPLNHYLKASEQHLFRRSQVRQVLAYLRDADRLRYSREVQDVLDDSGIRTHIKEVVLALMFSATDPDNAELALVENRLRSGLAVFAEGRTQDDKFAQLVWQHLRSSESWFHLLESSGRIAEWLASDKDRLVDMTVEYLRLHQRQEGDRVAAFLEPYVSKGDDWRKRLLFVVQWADQEKSFRFHELLLRLIDDGTLDEARGPIAINSTFWDMFHGLGKSKPAWMAAVLAHWLRRRLTVTRELARSAGEATPNWHSFFDHNESGAEDITGAAAGAASVFVSQVLPLVLDISDSSLYNGDQLPPKRDVVWSSIIRSEHRTVQDACRTGLATALEALAKSNPGRISEFIAELRQRDTFMSNYLLLKTFSAGAQHFADDAAQMLCDQTWRFDCGYADSTYWVATQTITAIVPFCSFASLARLEEAILGYVPEYEHTRDGFKFRGHASFSLLSGIPSEYLSSRGLGRYRELERKFGEPPSPPVGIRVFSVGPPIDSTAAARMSDEQWLGAIAKHSSPERSLRWSEPGRGGLWELASMLREYVQKEPDRFVHLFLAFPLGTHYGYIERTLEGLKGTDITDTLKLDACRKAYREAPIECGKAIADLIGNIKDPLPDDAVRTLHWLATEHPDPESDIENGHPSSVRKTLSAEGLLSRGMNSTRGRAAEAIRDLIGKNESHLTQFRATLERSVQDKTMSVRSCAASSLIVVAPHDWLLANALLRNMMEPKNHTLRLLFLLRDHIPWLWKSLPLLARWFDKRTSDKFAVDNPLLATQYVERFFYYNLRQHFEELRPFVERMLRSGDPKVSEAGARLSSLAALFQRGTGALVLEAMAGGPSQRLGIAQIASNNIEKSECRAWCEQQLLVLFNDEAAEVCREAASCFHNLENHPLENYKNLISAFCTSAAYAEDSHTILYALEESSHRLPGITVEVCKKFLDRFSEEANDIRTRRAGDSHMVAKLVFRTYHQHQGDEWASQCLDLIDRMCLAGIHDAKRGLDEFER